MSRVTGIGTGLMATDHTQKQSNMKNFLMVVVILAAFFLTGVLVSAIEPNPNPAPTNQYGQPYVKTIEGHEYIINPNGGIIHKVNCRFCNN